MVAVAQKRLIALGNLIRRLRLECRLTQEALAGTEFTKRYVTALERGAVQPSAQALEFFAQRLQVPVNGLLEAAQDAELSVELDLDAQAEDFQYQFNYGLMLIRSNRIDEAFQLIEELEEHMQPYWERLPAKVRYSVHFLRGRAHAQLSNVAEARAHLEAALELSLGDAQATARTRNLLGAVYYMQGEHDLALKQHLECLRAIDKGLVRDLNFQFGTYGNLGNDYWAKNKPTQAINSYKKALALLGQDIPDDPNQRAALLYCIAIGYNALGNWEHSASYIMRALDIYTAIGNFEASASMSEDMAEALIKRGRLDDAEQLLNRAGKLLDGSTNNGLVAAHYRNRADLARHRGNLDEAIELARKSVDAAEANYQAHGIRTDSNQISFDNRVWLIPARLYAESLHIMALIEEERGNFIVADQLLQRAFEEAERTGNHETIHMISSSYAQILTAHGAHDRAAKYYQAALQSSPEYVPAGTVAPTFRSSARTMGRPHLRRVRLKKQST